MSNERSQDSGAAMGHFRAEELFRFGKALLISAGLPEERARDVAEVLQLINLNCFGGREAFRCETTFLADSCRDTPVPSGKPPVRLPGQGALARRAAKLANGVELYPTIIPLGRHFESEGPAVALKICVHP